MMFERWRWVRGHKGIYKVSDFGRVRSVDRTTKGKDGKTYHHKGRILKDARHSKRDGQNYRVVGLMKNGKLKTYLVHQLVLEAFRGPCPKGKESRHLDGREWNNRLDNLRWSTHSVNCLDKTRHGKGHFGGRGNSFMMQRRRKLIKIL